MLPVDITSSAVTLMTSSPPLRASSVLTPSCDSASLWQRLGGLHMAQFSLWPLLDERVALRALRSSRQSYYSAYAHYPHRFTYDVDVVQEMVDARQREAERGGGDSSRAVRPFPPVLRCVNVWSLEQLELFHLPNLTALSLLEPREDELIALTASGRVQQLVLVWRDEPCLEPLPPGCLPHSLTRLTLAGYDAPLSPGVLPTSLRYLAVGNDFNQHLEVGALPSGLIQLILASCRYGDADHDLCGGGVGELDRPHLGEDGPPARPPHSTALFDQPAG